MLFGGLTLLIVLHSAFISEAVLFKEVPEGPFPDRYTCYLIKSNYTGKPMFLSPSKSDQESKLIFDDLSKASINSSYRFVKDVDDVYEIENCGSENLVDWGQDTVRDRLRIFVVGRKDVTNSEWRLIREKSDTDAYQIVEAENGKNNLYLSTTFSPSTNERLALLWTGTNESDWAGDENLRRVFTFEKFKRDVPEVGLPGSGIIFNLHEIGEGQEKVETLSAKLEKPLDDIDSTDVNKFQPDPNSCYIFRDREDKTLVYSSEKKLYILENSDASLEIAWKFVASDDDDESSQSGYRIEKCLSEEYLVWSEFDETKQHDDSRHYVFYDVDKNAFLNEWLVVPESDGEHYQILDALSKTYNLYSSQVFVDELQLPFVWTGNDESDWLGDENSKRLWRLEKIELNL